jgi:hypothetical protein
MRGQGDEHFNYKWTTLLKRMAGRELVDVGQVITFN